MIKKNIFKLDFDAHQAEPAEKIKVKKIEALRKETFIPILYLGNVNFLR